MNATLNQAFAVPFDFPVVFTRGVFRPDNRALRDVLNRREQRRHRAAVFVDGGLAAQRPGLVQEITRYFKAHEAALDLAGPPRSLPGGEAAKNDLALLGDLLSGLVAARLDRHAFVVAVGGGALLDVVGFAAALVHRGLRLVRLPTTVLAQNDAGVGVKNAINFQGAKNMLGTFAPPFAVINDFDFLRTLGARDWTDGVAEAFKVAVIKDAEFFRWLAEQAAALAARDEAAMEHMVRRCAELHLEHIRSGGDPFELGQARPLDFGHWAAHKLEILSHYRLSHGSAVALGVTLDARYAVLQGWLDEGDFRALHRGLTAAGFSLWHELLAQRSPDGALAVLKGLDDFREHLGGELCVTMPHGIGRRREVHAIDPAVVVQAVKDLLALHRTEQPSSC